MDARREHEPQVDSHRFREPAEENILCGFPESAGNSPGHSTANRSPFASHFGRNLASMSRTTAARSNSTTRNSIRPASIFERSSTSLMSESRCSPLRSMVSMDGRNGPGSRPSRWSNCE